uniref:Uncharacterized protein n=1 Tax=Arundo donax TaxID=35708 RepID=A0A0A9CTB6_ARUDO
MPVGEPAMRWSPAKERATLLPSCGRVDTFVHAWIASANNRYGQTYIAKDSPCARSASKIDGLQLSKIQMAG